MQLFTGPAGSGKTFTVLEGLRAALRRKDASVRVLVPTVTMAQHLRDEIARGGIVFSPSVLQTLARFIEPWVKDLPQVSAPVFELLVEKCVLRANRLEFAKVAHLSGFHARLAAVIEECDTAGCDARALREGLPAAGLTRALAEVFDEVSRALNGRKLGLRATRLALAAARILESGAGPAKTIWLDGFFSFTDPELALIEALSKHADVTVTLPSDEIAAATRARLLAMGFEEKTLAHDRIPPTRELFVAPSIEREADEIARRILEEAAAGRSFREIGIIARSPEIYVPLMRATLERFGIPARFYFDSILMDQAAVRFLAGSVDAMLGGWEHAQTLDVMKLAPGAGISAPMDRFEFLVRERLPGVGLDALAEVARQIESADKRLARLLERLGELYAWRSLALKPTEWCAQFCKLRAIYHPARPGDGVSHETALAWRSQAQAVDAFEGVVAEAASSFDLETKLALGDFWPAVKTALRLTPLRVADQRRDVVHVLSAYEVRQWELPVVFVCGLVEGQFPRYRPPDPFLPEPARRRLNESGLRIRTAGDAEREERFLFDSALHRATASLILSYPKNDARGEQNLPSLFLDSQARAASRPVRLQPAEAAAAPACAIHSSDLLHVLAQTQAEVRPTALESYLQCPFQFFGRHTLRLEGAPLRPEERFDFLTRGKIVHGVIAAWLVARGSIDKIFDRIFRETAQSERLPASYKTELLRSEMLADLRRFAQTECWPAGYASEVEISCNFELAAGLGIRARVDRLLKAPDGRGFVIDYKYSKTSKDKVENQDLLQGPLYWLAAERAFGLQPAGMYYCSLRDGVQYAGWGEQPAWLAGAAIQPFSCEWLDSAIERSVAASRQIVTGQIKPLPSDLSKCRFCDFKDICRYEGAVTAIAEGA
ncbi:MAG TPA: PD-(D/E)XK nuclease family protein [Bryobacteraceae bacterium]|nr:PD-(D/E)XK nuclease family protein [Bryobacteraceae bacterium]